MSLQREFQRQGTWLFRYRSYLPLVLVPLVLIALRDSEYLEKYLGDLVEDIWEVLCVGISFLGLFVRCLTVGYVPEGTSGRNTKQQRADRLNTTGMYSIVRHPLYLGNFLIFLGMMMFTQVWWIVLLSILLFWLYYERIMYAEEEFLRDKFGRHFVEWAEQTPAFIPDPRRWKRPDLPFSLRTVLRREYTGFFVITSSFTILEVSGDAIAEGRLEIDPEWLGFFAVGLIVYFVLRTLKKKTHWLHVKGR